ncbi:hypothetical protein J437_LFUL017026 [Ladona fulva]|uniref:HTH CENPB-type domain-containing protein n=1 Tax=Ladona fulva TaxID=123851 RepID=A0A8K0PBP8_LADFU|nr:hypothetical protein J437_LFUL017026 [Ladona fulva]
MPVKTASRNFGVPRMSLKRRVTSKNVAPVSVNKVLGNYKPVFNQAQEEELVNHILEMETRFYGITLRDVRSLAFQLAEKNGIPHPFNFELGLAGEDWLLGFRRRHPEVSLRVSESTSAARTRTFNRPVVTQFFKILGEVNSAQQYPPHRIFNVDETSIGTVSSRNSGVLAKKGRRQVGRIVSGERGETTTAVICMSAGGTFVPPMLIFPRKRMKAELTDGAPPGTIFACNSSGWMRLEVFETWFHHFIQHAKPSKEDPALLLMDGHLSHTKNLKVIEAARTHFVTIVCLPPHCTHELQPLDVSVMLPLSTYYDMALEKWLNNHPGRVVTLFQISQIFGEAYLKACTPMNAIKGFKKCGIYPLDSDIFTDVDFVAAETTDQADHATRAQKNTNMTKVDEPTVLTGSTSTSSVEETDLPDDLFQPGSSGLTSCHVTDFGSVSPADVKPIPKMKGPRAVTKRRRLGATILTSSPYKNSLVDEKRKRDEKEKRQQMKMQGRHKKAVRLELTHYLSQIIGSSKASERCWINLIPKMTGEVIYEVAKG